MSVSVDVLPRPAINCMLYRAVAHPEVSCNATNGLAIRTATPRLPDFFDGQHSSPGVPDLLDAVDPSHVAGFVSALVVDPVDLGSRWTLADISKEVGETVAPPIANGDANGAVMMKLGVPAVVASLNHRVPNAIGRCVAHSMFEVGRPNGLAVETSTTVAPSVSEIAPTNDARPTAVTPTIPKRTYSTRPGVVPSDHCEFRESRSGQIWNRCHEEDVTILPGFAR